MSLRSRNAVLAALSQHYSDVRITIINDLSDLKDLVLRSPDVVFLGMNFIPSELGTIWISDYLDDNDISYTGSNQAAHELELNKSLAKQRVLDMGLMTSPFHVVLQNQIQQRGDNLLTFPLFVKPTDRGGGLGIDSKSVAHNFDQLECKIHSITTKYQSDSLVEEYLPGREFSVAILKNEHSSDYSVMPVELVAQVNDYGVRMLAGKLKSSNSELVLDVVDSGIRANICSLALRVFHALGARDYGRIDIRLDKHGVPHFLEANLLPSLISGYGSFPKACVLHESLDYESMILRITRLALNRSQPSLTAKV